MHRVKTQLYNIVHQGLMCVEKIIVCIIWNIGASSWSNLGLVISDTNIFFPIFFGDFLSHLPIDLFNQADIASQMMDVSIKLAQSITNRNHTHLEF